ncbi:MAG: hypothetical protein U9O98_06190 [Asgard group archaeon]|nr:hypothetical protein [Asgard group archaeon]
MPPRCPSCKGKMEYEPPNYVCHSCGLVVNRFDFDKTKRKHFKRQREEEDPEYEKRRKNREYLDWWESSKEDKKK